MSTRDFFTGLLEELTTGIKERTTDAVEFYEDEYDKADRNILIYNQRKDNMNSAKKIAASLRKLGVGDKDIMYYAKDKNPIESLTTIYEAISTAKEKAKASNIEFTDRDIKELLDIPKAFYDSEATDMSMSDFWTKTFNLADEHERVTESESSEGLLGNFLFGAMGIDAKARMREKLENEMYQGNLSVASLNRLVEREEYRNLFPGFPVSAIDEDKIPVFVSMSDANKYRSAFDEFVTEAEKDIGNWMGSVFGIADYEELKRLGKLGDTANQVNVDGQMLSPQALIVERNRGKGIVFDKVRAWAKSTAKRRLIDEVIGQNLFDQIGDQLPFVN